MRDGAVAFLEKARNKRLVDEREGVFKTRIDQFYVCARQSYTAQPIPSYELHDPALANFAIMSEVRAIVELPNEIEVTSETFQPVVDILPVLISRWHADVKTQMGQILKASYTKAFMELATSSSVTVAPLVLDISPDSALMDLATFYGAFSCSSCEGVLSCQEALVHECMGRFLYVEPDLYMRAVISATQCLPWSLDNLVTGKISCTVSAATIIEVCMMTQLCGLDWRSVTCRDMDQRKERFACICQECAKDDSTRVMNWRCIVSVCLCMLVHGVLR